MHGTSGSLSFHVTKGWLHYSQRGERCVGELKGRNKEAMAALGPSSTRRFGRRPKVRDKIDLNVHIYVAGPCGGQPCMSPGDDMLAFGRRHTVDIYIYTHTHALERAVFVFVLIYLVHAAASGHRLKGAERYIFWL